MKNKYSIINLINNNDKYFQYAKRVALSHEKIRKNLQRIPKIKHYSNKYNWKEINYLLREDN